MAFYAPPENVENRKLGPSLQAPPLPFACFPRAAFKQKKPAPAKSGPGPRKSQFFKEGEKNRPGKKSSAAEKHLLFLRLYSR